MANNLVTGDGNGQFDDEPEECKTQAAETNINAKLMTEVATSSFEVIVGLTVAFLTSFLLVRSLRLERRHFQDKDQVARTSFHFLI